MKILNLWGLGLLSLSTKSVLLNWRLCLFHTFVDIGNGINVCLLILILVLISILMYRADAFNGFI